MPISLSRRELLQKTTLAATGGLVGALASPDLACAGPKEGAAVNRQAAILTDLARQKYSGQDLADDIKDVEQDVIANLQSAAALARIPMQNADEPDFAFVPE